MIIKLGGSVLKELRNSWGRSKTEGMPGALKNQGAVGAVNENFMTDVVKSNKGEEAAACFRVLCPG